MTDITARNREPEGRDVSAVFGSSPNHDCLRQPVPHDEHSPRANADLAASRSNEVQVSQSVRPNGVKSNKPTIKNLKHLLSGVRNPFTPPSPAVMERSSKDRVTSAASHSKKAPAAPNILPTPDSDDETSLFVQEGFPESLRDPHPPSAAALQDPTSQRKLVDYSSDTSSNSSSGFSELETLYAQNAIPAHSQTQPPASREQRKSVRPPTAIDNATSLGDQRGKPSFATPISPPISRTSTNSPPLSNGKHSPKDPKVSALGAQPRKNPFMEHQPPEISEAYTSSIHPSRKYSNVKASCAPQLRTTNRPTSPEKVRKGPLGYASSESEMTAPSNHGVAARSQTSKPTTTNISSSPVSSTTSTPAGPKRLNKSLLKEHIQAERQRQGQQKSSQAQPSADLNLPAYLQLALASGTTKKAQAPSPSKSLPSAPAIPAVGAAKPRSDNVSARSSNSSGSGSGDRGDRPYSSVKIQNSNNLASVARRNSSTPRTDRASLTQPVEGSTISEETRTNKRRNLGETSTSFNVAKIQEHSRVAAATVDAVSEPLVNLINSPTASRLTSATHSNIVSPRLYPKVLIVNPGPTSRPLNAPRTNSTAANKSDRTRRDMSATAMSGKLQVEQIKHSASDESKKRKALEQSSEVQTKKKKVNVEMAVGAPRLSEVNILHTRNDFGAVQNDGYLAPPTIDSDEEMWEYVIYQKSWSTDERQSSTSLFSRYQNLDDANSHAERLYKHTNAHHPIAYSITFKTWETSTPNSFGGVCYQGVYVFNSDPTKLHQMQIWVSRNVVEAMEPGHPRTAFATKSIYMLRLYKLHFPEREDNSDNEAEAGAVPSQLPIEPIRQYQPIAVNEAYTVIEVANQAARKLHIDMSFKPLPKDLDPKDAKYSKFQMDRKFQESELLKLNDKLRALDPTLGGVEGCWESTFNRLDGEKYELKVERVGLTGPRNL